MWHSTYTPRDTLYLFQVAVQCQWAGVPDRGGCATVHSLNVSLYIKPICFTYRSRVYRTPTSISAPVSDACCAASVHLQWTHSQVFPHIQGTRKPFSVYIFACLQCFCLHCFDAVSWAAARASGLWKTERWGAGMVICLERGADFHMAQLMPLPLTVSSVKSRLVLLFWYRLTWVVLDKEALNGCVFSAAITKVRTIVLSDCRIGRQLTLSETITITDSQTDSFCSCSMTQCSPLGACGWMVALHCQSPFRTWCFQLTVLILAPLWWVGWGAEI